jgi:catechol 2,3-dioxygenase
MAESIDPATRMGVVALVVADLTRSLAYYEEHMGLNVLDRQPGQARLGAGNRALLELHEQPGARRSMRGRTGLYHFALLTPSRADLGRLLRHFAAVSTPIDGASDHGVSEAIYLSDPDGHGIEVYRDRPREEWPYADGTLQMVLDPLDAAGIVAAADDDPGRRGMADATMMGHVHLHVAHISSAEQFYVDTLGFDLMQRFADQASFVSAGGYHHHLGLNVWAGVGAPPPSEDAARLLWYEVVLPDAAALEDVLQRLEQAGQPAQHRDGRWWTKDPAQNGIALTVAP